jgi:hypothetical protein
MIGVIITNPILQVEAAINIQTGFSPDIATATSLGEELIINSEANEDTETLISKDGEHLTNRGATMAQTNSDITRHNSIKKNPTQIETPEDIITRAKDTKIRDLMEVAGCSTKTGTLSRSKPITETFHPALNIKEKPKKPRRRKKSHRSTTATWRGLTSMIGKTIPQ